MDYIYVAEAVNESFRVVISTILSKGLGLWTLVFGLWSLIYKLPSLTVRAALK
jgi:hypothetical protein